MATLWEIEHDWGYDDDDEEPFDGDDEPYDGYPEPYDDSEGLAEFLFEMVTHYPFKRHVCRVYSICDECGKLEYITGLASWWDIVHNHELCQCIPF